MFHFQFTPKIQFLLLCSSDSIFHPLNFFKIIHYLVIANVQLSWIKFGEFEIRTLSHVKFEVKLDGDIDFH